MSHLEKLVCFAIQTTRPHMFQRIFVAFIYGLAFWGLMASPGVEGALLIRFALFHSVL